MAFSQLAAQTIYKNDGYQWKGNEITQGKFKGKAVSATKMTSNYEPIPPKMEVWNDMNPPQINRREWTLKEDISHLPQYTCDNILENAIYNMALEESILAIEPDSTFRTGIAWGGVWTRDVSYSIIHSLAQLHPEVCMKSLRAKVTANNRIIQDTGTGGAWPISTDRLIWAVAAWEVYKVTGDRDWLHYIYPIIKNSIMDDINVNLDQKRALLHGETSYMDWREQEYPMWMEPADIYNSMSTVDNAVFYMAVSALADICTELKQPNNAQMWKELGEYVKGGINSNLWLDDKGYYSIYLYGENYPILGDQSDAMGGALAILSGIADNAKAKRISENLVSETFGTPCIYPNLKDQYPYHNDATWPFVQGYWMKACAKAGNEQGLLHSIGSLYRGAALWLSNEENYEITTGDYQLTKLNSPRQLWSVAAQAAVVPNIYFGMVFNADHISFHPFVPKTMKGTRQLSNFKYRNAVLNLTVKGYGNEIASFTIDGNEAKPEFLGTMTGNHDIVITLANKDVEKMAFTIKPNAYLPLTPEVNVANNTASWKPVDGAVKYEVIRNGDLYKELTETTIRLTETGEYAVRGVSADGVRGYICHPWTIANKQTYAVKDYAPSDGKVVEITRTKNVCITIPFSVKEDGVYSIYWEYANGNGPITTENKCATRLANIDEIPATFVFPHRGKDEWNNWGMSNRKLIDLKAGEHNIMLYFNDNVENMNLKENRALLRNLIVERL